MIRNSILVGALCTIGTTASSPAQATDWLQWLGGPNRLNRVEPPTPANSPNSTYQYDISWQVELGLGYSSILVSGERLVAAYAKGKSDRVALLDANTGKTLWERPIGPVSMNGPLSTPAAGGGRLFAVGGQGELHALRLSDGASLWHLHLVKDFGAKPAYLASSPLLVRDRLVLLVGGGDDKSMVALNADDGAVLWTSQSDMIDCGSPTLAVLDGVEQVIAVAAQRVFSVRLSDGKLLWSLPCQVDAWATALPLGNDRVFLPMRNEHMVIECKRRNESWNVRKVWVNTDLSGSGSSFTYWQNLLIGSTNSGVVGLDADSGEVKWRREAGEGAVTRVGQQIAFIERDRGWLSLLSAGDNQTMRWEQIKLRASGGTWTPITSSGTDLYVRADNVVTRFARSGEKTADTGEQSVGARETEAPQDPHHKTGVRGVEALLKPGMLTLLGEVHGTAEVPAFLGNLAHRALQSDLPVRIGLEIPNNLQSNVDTFLASQGNRQDVGFLTQGSFWNAQDGRSSKAIVGLLDKIRRLKQDNQDIAIFLFDVPTMSIGGRDKQMAENILSDLAAYPRAVHLVLTGNLHARTNSVRFMGWHILQRHKQIISLNLAHSGGSAWVSNRDGRGPIHYGGTDRGEEPFIERLASWDGEAYHGFFYVGAITASPPATGLPDERDQ